MKFIFYFNIGPFCSPRSVVCSPQSAVCLLREPVTVCSLQSVVRSLSFEGTGVNVEVVEDAIISDCNSIQ